jgi:hypothetical protein
MASEAGRVPVRRAGTPGPRGGGVFLPEFQRTRLLDATLALVAVEGFQGMLAYLDGEPRLRTLLVVEALGAGPRALARRVEVLGLTKRRYRALAAVADLNGRGLAPSNREVSEAAGIPDQSHISHLMARLAREGLVQNTHARAPGNQKAWRLTADGEAVKTSVTVRVG